MDYGLVYENENVEVWFEPITDEEDGFVINNKDDVHSIRGIYVLRQ